MKLCKDCKHYITNQNSFYDRYDRCNRKNVIDPERINDLTSWCEIQREDSWLMARLKGTCGREARFFEPKEVMP